jgi:hypothetical protein
MGRGPLHDAIEPDVHLSRMSQPDLHRRAELRNFLTTTVRVFGDGEPVFGS